jgi:hypothetical protein
MEPSTENCYAKLADRIICAPFMADLVFRIIQ